MSNTTKPTTQNQIIDYLQITTDEYNENLFQVYWNWCKQYGASPSQVQQLLANAKVSKWFVMEYTKLQNQFLTAQPNLPKNTQTLEYHYRGFVTQIFAIYPKAMIGETNQNPEFLTKISKHLIYAN